MDTPQPIRIHIGHDVSKDLILLNGLQLTNLHSFYTHYSVNALPRTRFDVVGCFPIQKDAPDNALSNESYPLRIALSQRSEESVITFLGRPIGCLTQFHAQLHIDSNGKRSRLIRLFAPKMDKELIDALIFIKGVEVVIDPSETAKHDDFSGIEETTFNA